jgi:site-specific recombinase XerD
MLHLYRRHQRDCEAGHKEESRSGEFEENKKGWKHCKCPIFLSGTLARHFRRRSTERSSWEDARAVADHLQKAGNWEGKLPDPLPAKPLQSNRVTIQKAIQTFSAEFSEHAAPNTQKKYTLLLNKLKGFASDKGYVLVEQWTPQDVRDFRASWKVAPQTAAKNLSTIKAFFEFCVSNEWITRNPARFVKNQRTRDAADRRNEQKLPFSDEELKRMYEACKTQYGKHTITWSRKIHHKRAKAEPARYRLKWTGQDLADFISLSVYTGLRISDVATFRADRLQPTGEILVRTTKAGTHVFTWVPAWLQQRIRERAKDHGQLVFGEHQTTDMNVVTDVWRRKLKNLWELCGPWQAKPTPHRFRHTFARIILQRGVSIRDVADLLGNTEQICRKHYAAWIPERQARLTKILQEAFQDKPKLAIIRGKR